MAVGAHTKTDRLHNLTEICRGTPERVAVCRPQLPAAHAIVKYLARIDSSRRYSNHGGLLLELQERLRESVGGAAHVAVAASGTAALTGAILATAGRAKSRRKICLVPAYTFIGTVAAIEQCGYTPYFVDVDADSWMIDAAQCERHRLLDRVGLVVPVAAYGRPVRQTDWSDFFVRTGIPVVIDGAAAFESLVDHPKSYLGNVPVAVSFHATKSFCTGEGGAVFCGDAALRQAAIQCLNFGYDLDRVCRKPCINGKMSEYHAAIGLAELDRWDAKRSAFQCAADLYRGCFGTLCARLHLAPSVASNYVLFEAKTVSGARSLTDAFEQSGIGHRAWYGQGVHRQPYCESFGRDDVPIAEDLAARLIGLPMSIDITQSDVQEIAAAVSTEHSSSVRSGRLKMAS